MQAILTKSALGAAMLLVIVAFGTGRASALDRTCNSQPMMETGLHVESDASVSPDFLLHQAAFIPGSPIGAVSEYTSVGAIRVADIELSRGDPFIYGTATLIRPDIIITAGHNFCNMEQGTWLATGTNADMTVWEMRLNHAFDHPDCGMVELVEVWMPARCIPSDSRNEIYENDIALARLIRPIDHCAEDRPIISFSDRQFETYLVTSEGEPIGDVILTGVFPEWMDETGAGEPIDSDVPRATELNIMDMRGLISWPRETDRLGETDPALVMLHSANTVRGVSGAGIRIQAEGQDIIIGVHVGTTRTRDDQIVNVMRRLTDDVMAQVREWQ